MKNFEALKTLEWETRTNEMHHLTGEYMLVHDVRYKECDTIKQALQRLEDIEKACKKLFNTKYDKDDIEGYVNAKSQALNELKKLVGGE